MRGSTVAVAVTTLTVAGVVVGSGTAPSMAAQERTIVCHKPGTLAEHEITIAAPAVAAHERHGDTLGACPVPVEPVPAPEVIAAPQGTAFTVRWATVGPVSSRGLDVQYRIGTGGWRTWVNDTTTTRQVFGVGARPVRVSSGSNYAFRVRPGSATTDRAFSSPQAFRVR
jgi:hypothetical protein